MTDNRPESDDAGLAPGVENSHQANFSVDSAANIAEIQPIKLPVELESWFALGKASRIARRQKRGWKKGGSK